MTVRSAGVCAQIDPFGAQLSVLQDARGYDLLWHGDPDIWAGRAPVLFPIVGMLAGGSYRLGANRFPLARHGFARGKPFETLSITPSSAVFRLRDDAATLAVYPFPFELDVSFTAEGATLSVQATVRNVGPKEMPASLGFHPGFRWPLPYGHSRAAHFIEFDADEPDPIRRITAEGLMSLDPHPTPVVNRRLALTDALFRDDVIILDKVRSRSVRYGAASGPQLEIRFPDAQYLGIWTKPDAEFICIEPWQGVTDTVGFADDIRHKPGVFMVAPGATHSLNMAVTLHGT